MRTALWLVFATISYNVFESVVALWAGIAAGSIALVGFGLDAVIELAAASIMFRYLLAQSRGNGSAHTDGRVLRFVGITFIALAAYVLFEAIMTLRAGEAPAESTVGIVLAILSLIAMPLLAWGKLRAAKHIGSAALRAEAKETIACSYLSFALLLGLSLNAIAGWWWADPAAALLMIPWLLKEGIESVRGHKD